MPNGDPSAAPTSTPTPTLLIGGLLALGIIAALHAAATIAAPIAAALVAALTLQPVSAGVRARVGRRLGWLGPLAAALLFVGLIAAFAGGIAYAAREVLQLLPQFWQQAQSLLDRAGIGGGAEANVRDLLEQLGGSAKTLLSGGAAIIGGLLAVFFLLLLMLLESRDWHSKLLRLAGREGAREWDAALAAIGQKFRRYFAARLLLGAVTGALYCGWLALFGVDLLIVWFILTLLLNFIPNVGSIISGALPTLYALVTKDLQTAALIGGGLFAIEQMMGEVVDPKLLGRQLALSPLAILVSLLFWAYLWGVAGALLAVPMTVLLMVVFAHVPALRPVALLLSDERDYAGLDAKVAPD